MLSVICVSAVLLTACFNNTPRTTWSSSAMSPAAELACAGADDGWSTSGSLEASGLTGSLPRAAIQDEIRSHGFRYAECGERFAIRQGRLVLTFVIDLNGRVACAYREQERAPEIHDAMTECVIDVARTWRFPRPSGDGAVKVHYPFSFRWSSL